MPLESCQNSDWIGFVLWMSLILSSVDPFLRYTLDQKKCPQFKSRHIFPWRVTYGCHSFSIWVSGERETSQIGGYYPKGKVHWRLCKWRCLCLHFSLCSYSRLFSIVTPVSSPQNYVSVERKTLPPPGTQLYWLNVRVFYICIFGFSFYFLLNSAIFSAADVRTGIYMPLTTGWVLHWGNIYTVEALVCRHPRNAKKVSVTEGGRLRQWFSFAANAVVLTILYFSHKHKIQVVF